MEIVERIFENFYDQPCHWGCRVNQHGVYCTNEKWKEKPRKCHHSWYFGKDSEEKDENCEGFKPNERWCTCGDGLITKKDIESKECETCRLFNGLLV